MPSSTTGVQSQNGSTFKTKTMSDNLDELAETLKQHIQATEFPGFEEVRTDSEFLKKFIRLKDGNVEGALKAIKKYYAYIKRNESFIEGTKPKELTDAFNNDSYKVLPGHFEGVKVVLIRYRNWKTKEVNNREFQISMLYLMEALGRDPVTQENGIAFLCDLGGLRLEHVFAATPREMYRVLNNVTNGLPMRVKGIHALNPPSIFWPVYKIVTRLLSPKMRSRLFLHDGFESVHEVLAKEQLPVSLGGTLEEDDTERHWIEELLEKNDDYHTYWRVKEDQAEDEQSNNNQKRSTQEIDR